jgi:hypothetical protein
MSALAISFRCRSAPFLPTHCAEQQQEDSALAPGVIERVEVLGSPDNVPFTRTRQGLEVRVPERLAGAIAVALKDAWGGLV